MKVALTVIVIVLLGGYIGLNWVGNNSLRNLDYAEVEMSQVADGSYQASVEAMPVKVELEVVVNDHQIEAINLLDHRNGLGKKAEDIIPEILAQNSYEVDAISGATLSSETIKSAVSHALDQGQDNINN